MENKQGDNIKAIIEECNRKAKAHCADRMESWIFLMEFVRPDTHVRLEERFLQMCLRRRALDTTETELRAIAAAANIGFSKMPKEG